MEALSINEVKKLVDEDRYCGGCNICSNNSKGLGGLTQQRTNKPLMQKGAVAACDWE